MTTVLETILRMADAGESVDIIATAVGLKPGRVYMLLREHRPERRRKRRRTSDIPRQVLILHSTGIKPRRIAFLLGVTRAYIYRVLGEVESS